MTRYTKDQDELTAEEAAAYLDVDLKQLPSLLERFGIGRHYEPRHGDEFVYDLADIEKVKRALEAEHSGSPG